MHDSKPERYVQQYKSLKVTQKATNRDKRVNEASIQNLAINLLQSPQNIE